MDPANLIGTGWRLKTMNGSEAPKGLTVTLTFESDGKAFGRAGHFYFKFRYWASGDDIVHMGREAGRNGSLSDGLEKQADDAMRAINSGASYRLSEGRLEMFSSQGDTLVFVPT